MPKSKKNSILVVGSDSAIGTGLIKEFESSGTLVFQTSRRKNRINEQCSFLDLSENIDEWKLPNESISSAIICAGITSIEMCEMEPDVTRKINITNTVALTKKLIDSHIFVIFLSSNAVFDGKKRLVKSSDNLNPRTEYGRQKVEVENELLKFRDSVAIVRFSKILLPTSSLIKKWIHDLQRGIVIYPFHDMFFSPVSLEYAIQVLKKIIDKKLSGITHVSANEDISYENFARNIARLLNVTEDFIVPISYRKQGIAFSSRYTSMNCDRLLQLGFTVPNPTDVLYSVLV